ncbi:major facilitator superfamily domain-containing protein [Mycena maculata]|uniref:Major facilitator superfamily domain-containing protein n=1 Tax=Mycena maculata TaxID=230809 RepID=A0AAD7NYN5_9AGAR|nr:major facilitator superfamily domain-containing protein [Mycena maculata]
MSAQYVPRCAASPAPRSSLSSEPKLISELQLELRLEKQTVSTTEQCSEAESEDQIEYPTGLRLGLITLALCLSVFLVALDNTIIATAIPKITDQFDSLEDVGWYGSAYLLTTAAFQLLYGRLYSFLSMKWVYMGAISVFELGSLICGISRNSKTLIVGRAIAGIGSSGIFTGALIIASTAVPMRKRPVYTGIIGAVFGIANPAGLLMGGAFADKVSWRWCFYINLPIGDRPFVVALLDLCCIGGITLLVITFFFKTAGATRKSQTMSLWERINQFDPFGTIVFIPAVVCLLLALQWGGSKYPWSNGRIIALLMLFGVLISAFIAVQIWKQDMGTCPPRILKKRNMMAGTFFALCLGSSYFIMVYFLPIWFQAIKGVSAVKSGIDNLPLILSLVISILMAGAVVSAAGYYTPFMISSSVLMTVGAGLLSMLSVTSGHAHWIAYQAIYGLGVGLGLQQPLIAVQTVLSAEDIPTGTSLIMFMQTLGGALFISVGQNVFSNKLTSGLAHQVPGVNPAVVLNAGATSLQYAIDPSLLPAVLSVYNHALVSAFYVSIAMAGLSLVGSTAMEWKSIQDRDTKNGHEPN